MATKLSRSRTVLCYALIAAAIGCIFNRDTTGLAVCIAALFIGFSINEGSKEGKR